MKMYFCIDEHVVPTPSEKAQPGGGKYITHSQTPVFYSPDNLRAEYGYATRKRCEQELGKMGRLHKRYPDLIPVSGYSLYIEEHEVGEAGGGQAC